MQPPRPFHVGLTGNIASGKSTVARQFAASGATVFYVPASQAKEAVGGINASGESDEVAEFMAWSCVACHGLA